MTMKRALEILVSEGIIYRQRGQGSFILPSSFSQRRINVLNKESQGLTKLLGERTVRSEVLQFEVRFPYTEVARHLMIEKSDPVYEIRRVRYVGDELYVIEHTFMPSSLITGVTKEVLDSSIYQIHPGRSRLHDHELT